MHFWLEGLAAAAPHGVAVAVSNLVGHIGYPLWEGY